MRFWAKLVTALIPLLLLKKVPPGSFGESLQAEQYLPHVISRNAAPEGFEAGSQHFLHLCCQVRILFLARRRYHILAVVQLRRHRHEVWVAPEVLCQLGSSNVRIICRDASHDRGTEEPSAWIGACDL